MSEEKTLEQLLADQREAKKALESAMEQQKKDDAEALEISRKATHRVQDARQVYDGIAKRIDAALAKMRQESPEGTVWKEGAA
jgi:hypothetical protein